MVITQKSNGSISTQTFVLASTTALAQILTAYLFLVAARSSAPADFGVVAAAIAAAAFLASAVDFGTNGLWLRKLARHPRLAGNYWSVLVSKVLLALLLGALPLCLLVAIGSPFAASLVIAVLTIAYQGLMVYPRSMRRQFFVGFTSVADKASALITYEILRRSFGWNVELLLPSAVATGLSVGILLAVLFAWREVPWSFRRVKLIVPWRHARSFGIANLALSAQTLDSTVLVAIAGSAASGVYSSVARWTQPMGIVAGAYTSAMVPHAARNPDLRTIWPSLRRSSWILLLGVSACAAVGLLADWIVLVFLGEAYADAGPVLRVLAMSTSLAIFSQPSFALLQVLKYERAVSVITVAAVSIQLIALIPLALSVGSLAGALASLVGQFVLLSCFSVLLARAWRRGSHSGRWRNSKTQEVLNE